MPDARQRVIDIWNKRHGARRSEIAANDCQGEDPIAMMVERLRESAHGIAAILSCDAKSTYEWRTADVLLSLSQEGDRLRAALEPFANIPPVTLSEGDQRPLYAAHYWCVIGSPSKTHFTREDLVRARAALTKDTPCQET